MYILNNRVKNDKIYLRARKESKKPTKSQEWYTEKLRNSVFQRLSIVSLCRRTIDLLRQIKNAEQEDQYLQAKLNSCIAKIDRGIVQLGL